MSTSGAIGWCVSEIFRSVSAGGAMAHVRNFQICVCRRRSDGWRASEFFRSVSAGGAMARVGNFQIRVGRRSGAMVWSENFRFLKRPRPPHTAVRAFRRGNLECRGVFFEAPDGRLVSLRVRHVAHVVRSAPSHVQNWGRVACGTVNLKRLC